jgi:hypothetical protein
MCQPVFFTAARSSLAASLWCSALAADRSFARVFLPESLPSAHHGRRACFPCWDLVRAPGSHGARFSSCPAPARSLPARALFLRCRGFKFAEIRCHAGAPSSSSCPCFSRPSLSQPGSRSCSPAAPFSLLQLVGRVLLIGRRRSSLDGLKRRRLPVVLACRRLSLPRVL